MKPHGCQDMDAEECAIAIQLFLDHARYPEIAAELKRAPVTIARIVKQVGLSRGRRPLYRGPRQYRVDRLLASYPPEMRP